MEIKNPDGFGFASKRLNRIRPCMQNYIDSGKIAGVLSMVARHGALVHFERFGMQDIAAGKPMQFDTIFRIYSMTKPITSTAAMLLFEEGCFRINDPLSMYIPAFKDMKVIDSQEGDEVKLVDARREITIRDLFTHTTGMSYGFEEEDYLDGLYRKQVWKRLETHPDTTLKDFSLAVAQLPLRFHPGSAFHYSVSIDILGYLVEVISGVPFDRFLQERIFEPLGMADTSFWASPQKAARLASMYGPDEKNPGKLKDIDPNEKSSYTRPVTFFSGGGGLVSTAQDYLRFCQMLLNKGELGGVRLLGRKTVEFMMLNHLPQDVFVDQDPAYGFGLGGRVTLDLAKTQAMGSGGVWEWSGAASTKFWIDPAEDLVGILMLQYMSNNQIPLATDFRNLVYQAIVD